MGVNIRLGREARYNLLEGLLKESIDKCRVSRSAGDKRGRKMVYVYKDSEHIANVSGDAELDGLDLELKWQDITITILKLSERNAVEQFADRYSERYGKSVNIVVRD